MLTFFLPIDVGARGVVVLCLAAVLLTPSTALAQTPQKPTLSDLSLEQLMDVEVVYAASKMEQNPRFAPAAVTIVSRDEIERFGYRNLADVLRDVRGFYVTNDRNYSYVGVRGFGRPGDYNTRLLLLVDGHRVNDNVYDSGLIGEEFVLDIDTVERIEIVRGPSSSIYGTSSFFGVINVITRSDLTGGEAAAAAGTFGTYHGRLTGGSHRGGTDVFASATIHDSNGPTLYFPEFDSPATNYGVTSGTDFERSRHLLLTFNRGGFSLQAADSLREKGIPTGSYGTVFNDTRNHTDDGIRFVNAGYTREIIPRLSLDVRASLNQYRYEGQYVYDYPPVTSNLDRANGTWATTELMATSRRFERHTLVAGGELQWNRRQDQSNADETPYYSYLDLRNTSTRSAAYIQDEVRLSKTVFLNVGIRHDRYEDFRRTSPRAALILTPDAATTLKAIYGNAFRAPNQYEMFYSTEVPLQRPNPDLEPETIRTMEVVAERFMTPNVQVQASAFSYDIRDLISLTKTADEALQFENAAVINSRGAEAEVSWHHGNLTGRASYAMQRTRLDSGERLTNSPEQLATVSLSAPIMSSAYNAAVSAQYVDNRLTIGGNQTSSFVVANATLLARRMAGRLDASLSVYNLFNHRYADPASEEHVQDSIQQDGRTVRFKLTARF